jgi:VanZ family protein
MRVTVPAIARRLDPWAPPLVLMAVIFAFSAQPDLNSGLGTIDLVGRKLIHASEYALLTFLWWRALRTIAAPRTAALFAFSLAVGYAGTDEFHQHFIKGRHGTPVDVGIDACGAAIAALLIRRRST